MSQSAAPQIRVGIPDLVIGEVDGPEVYSFGAIGGLEIEPSGRIFVADFLIGSVLVYSTQGEFLFRIGRSGDGPREYKFYPCNISILRDGFLWIVSDGDGFLRVDPRRPDLPATLERIDLPRGGPPIHCEPVGLDDESALVAGAPLFDRDAGLTLRRVRLDVETGQLLGETLVERPSLDEMGWRRIEPRGNARRIGEAELWERYAPPPYGNDYLEAWAPDGRFATGVTARYRINIYDVAARLQRVIERDVSGPPLTAEERRRTSELMDRRRREAHPDLPYPYSEVPRHKTPLRKMWFDRDGRLWLERYLEDPTNQAADVYGKDGELLFEAEWPVGISLELGAIRRSTGLGVRKDDLGVSRVVRLRFTPKQLRS